jgi:hypothetical protein
VAAVTQFRVWDGAGPTSHDVTAGTGVVSFSRADAFNDTGTPIALPGAGARKFSELRYGSLYVNSGGGSTTLSNLKASWASGPSAGLTGHFFTGGQATYTQNNGVQGTAAGNYPADDAITAGTAPTNYTALTTSPQVFDATGGAAVNAAKSGKYLQLVVAVDGTNFASGGNLNTALPNIVITYDEA